MQGLTHPGGEQQSDLAAHRTMSSLSIGNSTVQPEHLIEVFARSSTGDASRASTLRFRDDWRAGPNGTGAETVVRRTTGAGDAVAAIGTADVAEGATEGATCTAGSEGMVMPCSCTFSI